jgi:integrase
MVETVYAWLAVRGAGPGPLLRPLGKYGQIGGGRWSIAAASKRAAELLEVAGLQDVGCHDFRRTFASDALDAGVDAVTVAKVMGHANVRTTQGYDRRGIDTLRTASRTVWKPF